MKRLLLGLVVCYGLMGQSQPQLLQNGWVTGNTVPTSCSTGSSPDFFNSTNKLLYGCVGNSYVQMVTTNNSLTIIPSALSLVAPSVTATCSGTCVTTYGYIISAIDVVGITGSTVEVTVSNAATLDVTHYNTIHVPVISGATSCLINRTRPNSTGEIWDGPCGSTVLDNPLTGNWDAAYTTDRSQGMFAGAIGAFPALNIGGTGLDGYDGRFPTPRFNVVGINDYVPVTPNHSSAAFHSLTTLDGSSTGGSVFEGGDFEMYVMPNLAVDYATAVGKVTYVEKMDSHTTTNLYGDQVIAFIDTGTATNAFGNNTSLASYGGTIGTQEGGKFISQSYGGTVTSLMGVHAQTTISGGTVTNGYGLKIEDTTGASNNWAIKTGAGTVQLGDSKLVLTTHTPASATEACTAGTFNVDAGFVYVCTTTNAWKRAALTTW